MKKATIILVSLWVLFGCLNQAPAQTWSVRQRGTILEIFYGTGTGAPQYAALHLDSSYFRMVYASNSGWGTSVILLPSFWSRGIYYQGAPVAYSYRIDGSDLLLSLTGNISSLHAQIGVHLFPPGNNEFRAQVTASVTGDVQLDYRPGEAFKPVMLSSMHVSDRLWDSQGAYVDCRSFPLPWSGWIIQPPIVGRVFGLVGGTSDWKVNAPTMEVVLDQPLQVTGWVTYSTNPNDDNVGYWAASNLLLRSWGYTLRAAPSRTGYEVSGQVNLRDYVGNVNGLPITVELRPAGNPTPLRTETVYLNSNRQYTIIQVPPGTYDLAFKGTHWLRSVLRNLQVTNICISGLNATLINGDVNNDNQINDLDLASVLLGLFDLNGDGQHNHTDLSIVLSGFGQRGQQ